MREEECCCAGPLPHSGVLNTVFAVSHSSDPDEQAHFLYMYFCGTFTLEHTLAAGSSRLPAI